jgi:hypothetical protein
MGSTGRGFGNKHSRNNIGTGTGTGAGTVSGNGAMTSGGYSGSGVNNQGGPFPSPPQTRFSRSYTDFVF